MNYDVFFISYDEPGYLERWNRIARQFPSARHVHGVKGFNGAYQECARQSRSERFFTIDGDNEVQERFFAQSWDFKSYPEDVILSFSAKNSINGLEYGNGGIKCWPRLTALSMKTHECTLNEGAAVDFIFALKYYKFGEVFSTSVVHGSPFQAFRAGFREGAKLCMAGGRRPSEGSSLRQYLAPDNWNRLRIWCSIGTDAENGEWALLGARMGCEKVCLLNWDPQQLSDYDWFNEFWTRQVQPFMQNRDQLMTELERLESVLNQQLGLQIQTLSPKDSVFFKSLYVNPVYVGPL